MLKVAYLYAHHRWWATTTNLINLPPYPFNSYNHLLESDQITEKMAYNYQTGSFGQLFPNDMKDKVGDPNLYTPSWILTTQENEGVPYAWGLSSGLVATQHDKEIDINPPMQDVYIPIGTNHSFDELIANKYFAGNTYHARNDSLNSWAAGVDCVGLINNAWRMGTRIPMIPVRDEYSLPIRFKDLKPGDILMDTIDHVMLFEKFDPPLNGEPGVGTTFWVYEAAGAPDWKVRYHQHAITDIPTPNTDRPGEEQVTIDGLSYTPRTYIKLVPMDVVLVIDTSGSIAGDKLKSTKDAARAFVSLMRPGDKLGIIAFSDTAHQVYPLIPNQTGGLATIDLTDQDDEQGDAIYAIDHNISAGGDTSIGEGLNGGYWDLFNYGTTDGTSTGQPDPFRVIIFLAMGMGAAMMGVFLRNLLRLK